MCVCVCRHPLSLVKVSSLLLLTHAIASRMSSSSYKHSTTGQLSFCVCSTGCSCLISHLSPFLCLGSLKLECDKLASEKSEMQRHYIMVGPDCWGASHKTLMRVCYLTSSSVVPQYYEMSYGLNIEMHKQVTAAVGQSPSAAQFCRSDCRVFFSAG